MGDSPDGLVFSERPAACAVGIIEAKCHYSLRAVKIDLALSSPVSQLQQRAQDDAQGLSSNPRDNDRGRGGDVRFRQVYSKQYEAASDLQ